jgi:hypothetical protein
MAARWTVLEECVRLSDSVLYEAQQHFYNRLGPAAWNNPQTQIPSYATCNTFIAKWYADIVVAHLREGIRTSAIDPAHPIYIVELGAGAGSFAYYFLRKLAGLRAASSIRHLDVRYVMTDFTPANVDVWARHPYLAPLAAAGLLDFGVFELERDTTIQLASGTRLSAETCSNPLVVIANYVLDSVRHDLFKIQDHELAEIRLSTRAPGPERPPLDEPGLLDRVRIQYTTVPAVASEVYADPDLAAVVDGYRRLADTTIAIPAGAFAGLRALLAISRDRLLLLASDKGHTDEDELYDPQPAHLTLHNGCFSMMVNFDAIGRYVQRRGGFWAATPSRKLSLKTALYVIGGARDDHADTLLAFADHVKVSAPGDFFDHLLDRNNYPSTIPNILRLLRTSGHDPRLLAACCKHIIDAVPTLDAELARELSAAIEETWANFFPGSIDLPFELARVMLAMQRPHDALRLFEITTELFGERAPIQAAIARLRAELSPRRIA